MTIAPARIFEIASASIQFTVSVRGRWIEMMSARVQLGGRVDTLDSEARGSAPPQRTCRRPRPPSRTPSRCADELANPPEPDHTECLAVQLLSLSSERSHDPGRATHARVGRFGTARGRACAPRPRPSSTPGRSRPRSRASSPPRRRRCRPRRPHGQSPSAAPRSISSAVTCVPDGRASNSPIRSRSSSSDISNPSSTSNSPRNRSIPDSAIGSLDDALAH